VTGAVTDTGGFAQTPNLGIVRSSRRILPVALALLLAATAFGAHGSVPAGYQVQSSTPLAPGVDHESLTLADPAQSVHVARVAPGAARLAAVSSHNAVANQDVGAELPSDMCRRVGCFAGINADFSDATTAQPVGGVVSGGRLLRSPVPGRAQLIVTRDGRLQAGPLDWSGSVTASDGRTVAIGGVNVAPHPGDVVLYTPAWGGNTPGGADTELVVRSTGAIGAIGATTPVQIVGLRRDPGPIPAGGAVLAASGSASAVLQEFADRAAAGSISNTLDLRIRAAVDVIESVGGSPTILRGGQPAFADVDDSFTRARHPRALVGWNPAGEVVLVTVDAGRDGASGMTLAEAADLLVGLGASDGFGFDNTAATFVAGGTVQNLPVDDGDPAAPPTEGREVAPGHMERPAANALMVVANGSDPTPPPPSTNPGTGSGGRPAPGGTAATTAPSKLTTAGGGSAPATGGLAAPTATAGKSLLPGVGDILRNPTTKRPRRQKGGKGNKTKDGQEEEEVYAGDPSIPDWNDITAALTPEAVARSGAESELSLGLDPAGPNGPGRDVGATLVQLLAAGMIVTVLWGLRRTREDSRPRPALWV
jgi:phosphodiester glycosidase